MVETEALLTSSEDIELDVVGMTVPAPILLFALSPQVILWFFSRWNWTFSNATRLS